MQQPIVIGGIDVSQEGRFHRQELISWWDQNRLARAKALVIGAGALGNELLKNLALVGVGAAIVADMDRIELSNLCRSVLFRETDIGRLKAEVAAERAKALYPKMNVRPFVGNIVHDLGAGVFLWADIVLCGLDNREARVAVNRACLRLGRPWVDGAIERLDGVARVFLPGEGACYECTMNETDWQMLEARRSCALLTRQEMTAGRTPTTATTSSIVAGLQCQEALKCLHGLPQQGGSGVVINGQTSEVYPLVYTRNDDCAAHDPLPEIIPLPMRSAETTVADVLRRVRRDLGADATIELSREIIEALDCAKCGTSAPLFQSLGKVTEDEARCPGCGEVRFPRLRHSVDGSESFLERTVSDLGLPPYDILIGRSGERSIGYLMAGDAAQVLGEQAAIPS